MSRNPFQISAKMEDNTAPPWLSLHTSAVTVSTSARLTNGSLVALAAGGEKYREPSAPAAWKHTFTLAPLLAEARLAVGLVEEVLLEARYRDDNGQEAEASLVVGVRRRARREGGGGTPALHRDNN